MPNDYENPKYTNKNEYHAGDGPFQFPWWAIVIAFVVWWPLGLVFIGLNAAMKNGRLGGFEQKAREATRDRTASGAKAVYNAEFRPIYDTPAQPQPKAAARPLGSGRGVPVDGWHSKVAGRACPAPTDRCFRQRGFGGTPDSKVEEGAGALRTKSNTAFV